MNFSFLTFYTLFEFFVMMDQTYQLEPSKGVRESMPRKSLEFEKRTLRRENQKTPGQPIN